MDKNVTAPRLIYGLLSEAEARCAVVFCRAQGVGDSVIMSQLTLFQGESFRDSSLSLSAITASYVECEVVLYGRRLIFELTRRADDGTGQFPLPASIRLLDLRQSPRIVLSGGNYPAEIRFSGGIILGAAQDISRNHVSISCPVSNSSLLSDRQSGYEIVVRAQGGNDIYRAENARLVQAAEKGDSCHAVFQWEGPPNQKFGRKAKRHFTESISVSFSCKEISDSNIEGRIELIEASLTGFSGLIRVKNSSQQPPLGLLLKSINPDITFSATRKQGDVYGFVILSSDQLSSYQSWISYVDQFRKTSNSQFATTQELAALLMESGFLKSKRLQVFGDRPELHLSSVLSSDPLLVRRYTQAADESHLSESISLFRLTEYSWLMHEVVSGVHGSGGISQLYEAIISAIKDEAISSLNGPRWLCVYYNPNLPVVAKKWESFSNRGQSDYFPTRLISISTLRSRTHTGPRLQSSPIATLSRSEKVKMSRVFREVVLELIDFWTTGIPNRQLSALLRKRGPSHDVISELIHSQDNRREPVACGYRIKTHYGVNSTGVLNSAWVFLKCGITQDEYGALLEYLSSDSGLCKGTDDVILVFSNEIDPKSCASAEARTFRLLITSLLDLSEETYENK